MSTRVILAGTTLICILLCAVPARAATVVKVSLQDPSGDPALASMHIAVDRDSVPAGKVTFRAVNQSKDQVHELIVVRTDPGQSELPYDQKKQEVVEKRVHHLGEVADLKPGRSGTMTLNLKPGSYLLICNQPGHYKAGMSTSFTVTK
ncbi:MAG TPA: copper resistance protein [Casimicrobiaceae bacterium]|nr:copper resistance protein [Casimicrobiaceae bacterium]